MSDENNLGSVTKTGSPSTTGPESTNVDKSGEPATQTPSGTDEGKKTEETVSADQYKELEKKLGSQGKELGDLRNFYDEISPLMDKLQSKPELIDAILKDKISPELIKPVVEGTVSEKDAKDVTKAHDEVKKNLGSEKYENTSPEDIKKLIEEGVSKIRDEFNKTIQEKDSEKDYEERMKDFMNSTSDFAEYAQGITKYIQEHPEITDLQTAYDAVKGKALQDKYKAQEEKEAADAAKDIAANAGGGSGQNTANMNKEELLDKLIGVTKNPNMSF